MCFRCDHDVDDTRGTTPVDEAFPRSGLRPVVNPGRDDGFAEDLVVLLRVKKCLARSAELGDDGDTRLVVYRELEGDAGLVQSHKKGVHPVDLAHHRNARARGLILRRGQMCAAVRLFAVTLGPPSPLTSKHIDAHQNIIKIIAKARVSLMRFLMIL